MVEDVARSEVRKTEGRKGKSDVRAKRSRNAATCMGAALLRRACRVCRLVTGESGASTLDDGGAICVKVLVKNGWCTGISGGAGARALAILAGSLCGGLRRRRGRLRNGLRGNLRFWRCGAAARRTFAGWWTGWRRGLGVGVRGWDYRCLWIIRVVGGFMRRRQRCCWIGRWISFGRYWNVWIRGRAPGRPSTAG